LGLLGIHEYFRRLSGDHRAKQLRESLTRNLIDAFNAHATDERSWFDFAPGSGGARLSHAPIRSGRWSGDQAALEVGLRSLRWLVDAHTRGDHYRAVSERPADEPAQLQSSFNQLPIEASATLSACIEAYAATQDIFWRDEAHKAFEWF